MKCSQCPKEFESKDKRKKYCCLRCANDAKIKDRNRSCKQCTASFMRKDLRQEFCSRSCSATFHNAGKRRHGFQSPKCISCESLSSNKSGYCTKACRQNHEIELWLDGKLDGHQKYKHAAYVQRYLEQRSRKVCEMPDCTEQRVRDNGRHILQVDHIDGNWRNNKPENLRLICPSCHALTDTFAGYNKGKGRTWKANYSQFNSKDDIL